MHYIHSCHASVPLSPCAGCYLVGVRSYPDSHMLCLMCSLCIKLCQLCSCPRALFAFWVGVCVCNFACVLPNAFLVYSTLSSLCLYALVLACLLGVREARWMCASRNEQTDMRARHPVPSLSGLSSQVLRCNDLVLLLDARYRSYDRTNTESNAPA